MKNCWEILGMGILPNKDNDSCEVKTAADNLHDSYLNYFEVISGGKLLYRWRKGIYVRNKYANTFKKSTCSWLCALFYCLSFLRPP